MSAWDAQAIFLAGLLENFDRWGLGMALEYLGEKAAEDASIARLLQADPRLRQVRPEHPAPFAHHEHRHQLRLRVGCSPSCSPHAPRLCLQAAVRFSCGVMRPAFTLYECSTA